MPHPESVQHILSTKFLVQRRFITGGGSGGCRGGCKGGSSKQEREGGGSCRSGFLRREGEVWARVSR